MAKMTIYVPDDLKGRMDQAEGVNWSPLACRAFEGKLAEIITQRGVRDMKDVATRLRTSKQKSEDMYVKRGRLDGQDWAKNSAEAEELERLAAYDAAFASQSIRSFESVPNASAYGEDEHFVFVIRPDDDGERRAARDFWEELLSDDAEVFTGQPAYIQAFADAALEVWNEVKDQL